MPLTQPPVSAIPSQATHPLDKRHHDPVRILCIDDDALFRALIKDVLEEANYTVLLAPDGESGLAIARREQPDLILLDLVLPGANGFSITTACKNDPCLRHIPVLILTRINNADLNPQAFDAGALFALQKTSSPRILLSIIQTALEYVHSHGGPSTLDPPARPVPTAEPDFPLASP